MADYVDGVRPFLAERGFTDPLTDEALATCIPVVRERVRTFVEAADALDYFFREPPAFDEKAQSQHLVAAHAPMLLTVAELVEAAETWEAKAIEAKVVAWLEPQGLHTKDIAHPMRVALTGRGSSPGLFDVLFGLGKARAVARLRAGAAFAANNPGPSAPPPAG